MKTTIFLALFTISFSINAQAFKPDIYVTNKSKEDKLWKETIKPLLFEVSPTRGIISQLLEKIIYLRDGTLPASDYNKLSVRKKAIEEYGAKEITLKTEDNFSISSLFYKREDAPINVIYVTGYFENYTPLKEWCAPFAALFPSFNIMSFDWRGHGDSSGNPNRDFGTNAYKDIQAAIDFVKKDNDKPVVIVGFCMGGALSLFYASMAKVKNKALPDAIVLNSPFTNILNVAKRVAEDPDSNMIIKLTSKNDTVLYSYAYIKAKIKFNGNIFDLRPTDLVKELDIPLCIEHSTADKMIPIHEGIKVFDCANPKKMFIKYEVGKHVRMHAAAPYQYRKNFYAFLEKFNIISHEKITELLEKESL